MSKEFSIEDFIRKDQGIEKEMGSPEIIFGALSVGIEDFVRKIKGKSKQTLEKLGEKRILAKDEQGKLEIDIKMGEVKEESSKIIKEVDEKRKLLEREYRVTMLSLEKLKKGGETDITKITFSQDDARNKLNEEIKELEKWMDDTLATFLN